MKTWKEYNIKEGTNPTDFDSAGVDQHPKNTGKPFDEDGMEAAVDSIMTREKNERDYQKKLHDLMNKRSKKEDDTDPNTIDPTKGPEGETPGGMIDKDERDAIKDYIEKSDSLYKKELKDRGEVPVKTTSTMFIPDKKGNFTPRNDDDGARVDDSGKATYPKSK